jgi:Branched-chain amino acid transport protein (AzlD)
MTSGAMTGDLASYLVLLLVGFLPNEVWRVLGVVIGRGLDEKSEFMIWVRAVAVAVLAAVIAKLILVPPGVRRGAPLGVCRPCRRRERVDRRRPAVCAVVLLKASALRTGIVKITPA